MKVTNLLAKCRKIVNPPYSSQDLLTITLTVLILMLIPFTVLAAQRGRGITGKAAGTASIALSPASLSVNHGDNFTVEIRENSNTEAVNAVQANLSYDQNKLDFVSISTTGSAFNLQFEDTGGGGSIRIGRASTVDRTGNQLVAKVTFTARSNPGPTTVSFTAGTAIVRSSDATDILGSSTGGMYTIIDPPPTVTVTSPIDNQVVSGSVTVAATASDDVAVTKVEFLVDGAVRSTDSTSPYSYSLNTTTLTNTAHTLAAKAYDANSSTTDSITVTVDNLPPSVPTGLSATAVDGAQIDLSWNASTDNIGVVGYDVYRNSTKIATVTETSYSNTGLTPGITYNYFVKARDGQGNVSGPSNTATATTIKLGDINKDGVVNIFDASIMASRWGTSDPDADLNGNGVVDIFDASILASNWEG